MPSVNTDGKLLGLGRNGVFLVQRVSVSPVDEGVGVGRVVQVALESSRGCPAWFQLRTVEARDLAEALMTAAAAAEREGETR